MRRLGEVLKGAYLSLVILFLYAPIAVLIIYSFNASKTMGYWTGFTLKWYEALFSDSALMSALGVTLSLAALSALIATVMGTAAAIGIHSMRKKPRQLVEGISQLPMVNPDLVTGISLMMLFVFLGVKDSYIRLLIAHVTFNLPYVIFSVLPRLRQSSNNLYEAALDLGCTPLAALWKVVVPDIMPGIVSGFILAFTLSLDDFVVSWFVSNDVQTLSMYIYSSARRSISPKINALSALLFVVVVALLLAVNIRSIRQERKMLQQQAASKRNG